MSWKAAATQVLVNTLRKAGLSLTPHTSQLSHPTLRAAPLASILPSPLLSATSVSPLSCEGLGPRSSSACLKRGVSHNFCLLQFPHLWQKGSQVGGS